MGAREFERIARIRARLTGEGPGVRVGIGDDAAVLETSTWPQVLSVDTAVQDVHFSLAFCPLPDVAYRSISAAVSDLAAMGARPRALLCALTLPTPFSDGDFEQLLDGLAQAQDHYDAPIVGGNLAHAPVLSLTTTVVGEAREPSLLRSTAKLGDSIYVTGDLGGAALGLELLKRGRAAPGDPFAQRFLLPHARIDLGLRLSGIAHAAIDVSDGLVQDLRHLCHASQVGAVIEVERLPTPSGLETVARNLGLDPVALALAGGDDYELVFTASAPVDPEVGTRIGEIRPGAAVVEVTRAGRPMEAPPGYEHF